MNSVKGSTKAQGFPLTLHDVMGDSRNTGLQPYKYIGKELDRTHGLDWYDHGARHYDPVTGRWNVMDALAEKYYPWSPYVSCGDDPVGAVDIDGDSIFYFKPIIKQRVTTGYIPFYVKKLMANINFIPRMENAILVKTFLWAKS